MILEAALKDLIRAAVAINMSGSEQKQLVVINYLKTIRGISKTVREGEMKASV